MPTKARFKCRASSALARRREVREREPHADVVCFEGNYGAYIEDLKRRKGPDADQPHRIAYKKLVQA